MASSVYFVRTMVIAVLAVRNYCYCEALSSYNVSMERQPQKMVEVIELVLPQNPRDRGGKDTRTKQYSGEQPRYEIFIKQNKKNPDEKTPKIKIVVEHGDYSGEKVLRKNSNTNSSQVKDEKSYQALPLSLEAFGSNADTLQPTNIKKESNHGDKSYDSSAFPSKRQIYSFVPQNVSYLDQHYVRHEQPVSARESTHYTNDRLHTTNVDGQTYLSVEKEKGRAGGSEYLSVVQREERLPLTSGRTTGNLFEQTDSNSRNYYDKNEQIALHSRLVQVPAQYDSFHAATPVSQPERFDNNYDASFEKRSSSGKFGASHSQRRNPHYNGESADRTPASEIGSPSPRRHEHSRPTPAAQNWGTAETEMRRPIYTSPEAGTAHRGAQTAGYDINDPEFRSARSPLGENINRQAYRQDHPTMSTSFVVSEGREYYENTGSYSVLNQRGSQGNSNTRTSPDSGTSSYHTNSEEGTYVYDININNPSVVSSSRLPYESSDDETQSKKRNYTASRPIRQNSNLGFPQSFQSRTQTSPTSLEAVAGSSHDNILISPCPDIFVYKSLEESRWFADVYVSTNEVLVGLRLDIILNKPADVLATTVAEVKSHDNTRFTILSLKKRLVPGPPEVVPIIVNFDEKKSPPLVENVNLNGRMICSSGRGESTSKRPVYVFPGELQVQRITTTERSTNFYRPMTERLTTTSRPYSNSRRTAPAVEDYVTTPKPGGSNSFNPNRPVTKKPNPARQPGNSKPSAQGPNKGQSSGSGNVGSNTDNRRPISGNNNNDRKRETATCGSPAIQPRPLITSGKNTVRGQWPWHVALYKNSGVNLNYSCGGSLISERHVVTAAHCVTEAYSARPLDAKSLLVYLGKHHLRFWVEDGSFTEEVSRVSVHPNYNASDFRSDIAILTLLHKINFTDFVSPICLWDRRNTEIEEIAGRVGTVVGWGFNERRELTEDLRQAQMPVVKYDVCLFSYPEFYIRYTSNTTYCAGFKNGTSVCNGDSGGGMVFPIRVNGEERWFLRGIVSLSPVQSNRNSNALCDTSHYAVFTDVAKYLSWIDNIMSASN